MQLRRATLLPHEANPASIAGSTRGAAPVSFQCVRTQILRVRARPGPLTAYVRRYSTKTNQGWGIDHDEANKRLIVSDGSSWLFFWDPETFAETGRVEVTDRGKPVTRLNELEMVGGELLANIWYSDAIARIDLETGNVIGWIDFATLRPKSTRGREDVFNGIAHDPSTGLTYVTGKLWPKLYKVRLQAQGLSPSSDG